MRKMFNISAGTLQNGTLPYSKVGTTILYDYEVLAILSKNRVN
jgi:hypothetical protein